MVLIWVCSRWRERERERERERKGRKEERQKLDRGDYFFGYYILLCRYIILMYCIGK